MNIGYPIIDEQVVNKEYTDYWIKIDDETVFTGKAWRNPNTGKISVKINDLIKKYIDSGDLPKQTQGLVNWKRYFETSTGIDDYITNNQEYTDSDATYISAPIDDLYDARQYLIFSYLKDMNPKINGTALPASNEANVYSQKTTGNISFTSTFQEFKYKMSCGDYAIYYLNEFGGWDSLLVKANKSENKTNYDYLDDTLTRRYLTEFTNSYDVVTGYTINKENIHHLLNSPKVYLHSLDKNIIEPVLIDTTSYDFKKRFSRLELTLKSARTQFRW